MQEREEIISQEQSDLGRLKALEVGESTEFPISKMCSIRVNVSNLNTIRGTKSLQTKSVRSAGIIQVTRIA